MVNMIVRLLADKMEFKCGRPAPHDKRRLLMTPDAFPALGKPEILQESLAFVAGDGVKRRLICQDINQLKSRETGYGHDESITSNCRVRNAYPPNRIETAEHLSRLYPSDCRGEGADNDRRPPHGGDAKSGIAHLSGSAAAIADAR